MRIVILDAFTANPGDLSWESLATQGELTVHDRTTPAELLTRAQGAELLLTNKVLLSRASIEQLPRLRYIGLLSTGTNVADLAAARERGIPVTNIPAYSTPSVAQMVFAQLCELCYHTREHSNAVHAGAWSTAPDFCFWQHPLMELAGKTMGIFGLGQIGQAVAQIAKAFGMQVQAVRRNTATPGSIPLVTPQELWRTSDIISVHCPLTEATQNLICSQSLAQMRPGTIVINTARGGVVNEADVAAALHSGHLGGYGTDVLSFEPPQATNPLLGAPNCIITPHIAWATKEARARLITIAAANVQAFLAGHPQNVVNP